MKAFVDTNILVYATYPSFKQNMRAVDFLRQCAYGNDQIFLSWSVIYEFLGVVTNPRLFSDTTLPFDAALENIKNLTGFPSISILTESSEHLGFLDLLNQDPHTMKGALIHDAHHVTLMREYEIKRIYTADTDFNKFLGIEVVNPLV